MRTRFFALALSSFLTLACDDSDEPDVNKTDAAVDQTQKTGDGAALPPSQGLDAASDAARTDAPDWVPGDYPPDLRAQTYLSVSDIPEQPGRVAQFKVHVPPTYNPRRPNPVLYAFHGLMQNSVMFTVQGTSFVQKSDAEGFILVMPNGSLGDGSPGGSWNGGVCCGPAAAQKRNDVALVRAIHREVSKHLNVDGDRVYATGLSNGGFLSYRLACEAADLFAAVAPLAGAIGISELGAVGTNPDSDFKTCTPSRRIPVLAIHGDADTFVPYAGLKASLDHLARENGCMTTTKPATQPMSGGDTTCVTYEDCPADVEVTGCTVAGGGHCWFGDATCGTGSPMGVSIVGRNSDFVDASTAVWNFVKRFTL